MAHHTSFNASNEGESERGSRYIVSGKFFFSFFLFFLFISIRRAWEINSLEKSWGNFDEEVARTGLSDDAIGPKVHISYHPS